MHQKFHWYIPRHNFVSMVDNGISDLPSLSRDLTNSILLAYVGATYPQRLPWRL